MSTFVRFRDANKTNEEGAGKILAKLVGQSVVVGAETSCRIEEKGGGADDSVDIQIGDVIILDADGYALGGWSDAIVNKTVTANVSGNPRIDVVVAYVDKAVEDAVNNNSPGGLVFDIIEGTPAGSPVPPNDATIQAAVGADNPFIKLAQIAVADGFVSIIDANITDLREQCSFQSGGKKLQYDPATNTWSIEDSLEIGDTLKADTITEKTANAGVTIDGVLHKDDQVILPKTKAYQIEDSGDVAQPVISLPSDDILRLHQMQIQENAADSVVEDVIAQEGWGVLDGVVAATLTKAVTLAVAIAEDECFSIIVGGLGVKVGAGTKISDFTVSNSRMIVNALVTVVANEVTGFTLQARNNDDSNFSAANDYGFSWRVLGRKA